MTGSALDQTEFIVAVVAGIVLAYLIYRIFRGEPIDRIVRLGVFIERVRHHGNGGVEPSEKVTETQEWPKRTDP